MSTVHEPHLAQPLAALQLSARARRVLERLGVGTVAEFALTPKNRFLDEPGCGDATYAEIERRVCGWLAMRIGDPDALLDDRRPLGPLLRDKSLLPVLDQLAVRTVGEFLALPQKALQHGSRETRRGLAELKERIAATRRQPPAAAPLLPESLRRLPLRTAGLPAPLVQQLEDLGCTTIGHALLLPAGLYDAGETLGTDAATAIRSALDQLFRAALEQLQDEEPARAADWPSLRGRLLAPLDDDDRDWLCQRIGLGTAPTDFAHSGISTAEQAAARDEAVRARLAERAPSLLYRLRHEVLRELDAFEGVVRPDRLAVGSWLHTLSKGSGDPMLPLRLCAFCLPQEVHLHDGILCTLNQRTWLRFLRSLRTLTSGKGLPRPLEEISQRLQEVVDPVPRGLLLHLLADTLHLSIRIEAGRGEVVLPQPPALAARLERLLHERGRPTRFLDLLYDYRERHRTAQGQRLMAQLRRDATFLQIGPDTWSLRAWHGDELERIKPLAEGVVTTILGKGGKQRIFDLVEGDGRTRHLVADLVRRDPRLRYLGRGEVCPASHERSQVLADLLRDFRRAAGEVPMSRFVDNQPDGKRRLVQRLLVENRLFVFPAPDRIDVLTNYPFNQERLQRLLLLVDEFLSTRNGYAPLAAVLEEVNRCDLGGSWLHPTLLGELLRRHGPFEVLPGGFVARATLGLGGWLMRRARNALREAAIPISVQELLAERPELAEFAGCLEQLLQRDPLVQTPDGTRYQIA